MNKLKNAVKLFIGWPLSIISILFIIKYLNANSSEIIPYVDQINYFWLIIGIVLFFVYYFLRSLLWRLILNFLNEDVSILQNAYNFELAEIKRFVPGNIWSFLSRGKLFNDLNVKKINIAKGILYEMQLLISGCAIVSILSVSWILNTKNLANFNAFDLIPVSILIIILFFIVIAVVFKRKYEKNKGFISLLFLPGFNLSQKLILVIFASAVFSVFGLANFLIFFSVFSSIFFLKLVISLSSFFTFAFLVGYISFITPMGLGVREGVVALGLSQLIGLKKSSFLAIYSRVILVGSELLYLLLLILVVKLKND